MNTAIDEILVKAQVDRLEMDDISVDYLQRLFDEVRTAYQLDHVYIIISEKDQRHFRFFLQSFSSPEFDVGERKFSLIGENYDKFVSSYGEDGLSSHLIDEKGNTVKCNDYHVLHTAFFYEGNYYGGVGFGLANKGEFTPDMKEGLKKLTRFCRFFVLTKESISLLTSQNKDHLIKEKISFALSKEYTTIFYVDLDQNILRVLSLQEGANGTKLDTRGDMNLDLTLKAYLKSFVVQEDISLFDCWFDHDYLKECFRNQQNISFRFRSLPNDNGQQYFETLLVHVPDEADSIGVVGFRSIDTLVQHEKEQQQKLEEANESLAWYKTKTEKTLEGIRTGMWTLTIVEGKHTRLKIDKNMSAILGFPREWTPEEVFDQFYARIDISSKDDFEKYNQQLIEGRGEVVYRWNHPTLGLSYMRCTGWRDFSFKDGIEILGSHCNVTQTYQSELKHQQELEEANTHLKRQMAIVNSLSKIYFYVSYVSLIKNKYQIVYADEDILNHVSQIGVLKDISDVLTTHVVVPVDQAAFQEHFSMEKVIETLKHTNSCDYEFQAMHTNKVIWCRIGAVLSSADNQGNPTHILLTIQDITENAETLAKLNSDLKEAVEKANEASKSKTDFLSSMSHDIRTPMNAMLGLTSIAKKNIKYPDIVMDCLNKINISGNHLLTLVNDILDISKIESGKLSMNPAVFSLSEAVESWMTLVQPMVSEKHLKFHVYSHNLNYENLYADLLRINQIAINVLSNAIKYNHMEGIVTLDISESELIGNRVNLVIKVSDTGIGIPPDFIKNLYKPFARATDSRINNVQGTGLGLAIVKRLVDLMGGTIEVQSKVNIGSTFTISLPIEVSKSNPSEYHFYCEKVLLVDNDPIALETETDTLTELGLKVEPCNSGSKALEICKKKPNQYQLILIDYKMPNMDGLSTTRFLRSVCNVTTPILICSAYDSTDFEKMAVEAGANGMVSKPLFKSSFGQKLNSLLHPQINKPEEQEIKFAHLNILVAEDNDLNYEIFNDILSDYGVTMDRACTGKEAVEMMMKATPGQYRLIFMDIQMPIMNGYDAAKAIRKLDNPELANIPIYAMTADAFAEDIEKATEAGMNGHIAKPIDFEKVTKILHQLEQ